MPHYEEYKKNKDAYLQAEREKGLSVKEQKIGGDFDLTAKELKSQLRSREQIGSILDRTKYFFEDAGVMEAKAARYRNLAEQGDDIEHYAATYSYHSAGKRKKSANKAADAFEKAAELEREYENDNREDPMTQLSHREEVMRARLIAMEKAAEVKSRSKENEIYRKQKAKLSCLSALRDQARMFFRNERGEQLKAALKEELNRIEAELSAAEMEMERIAPSAEKQWERAVGIPDQVKAKCKALKQDNPDVTEEDAEALMRLQKLASEISRPEYARTLDALNRNQMYPGKSFDRGELSRSLSFPLRAVLRDEKGMPINLAEQKKAEHNEKWLHALSTGNLEEKNEVLLASFRHFESLEIPSPRQIRERGVLYFLRNRPSEFYEIITTGLTISNLDQIDSFVKEYEDSHPEFSAKLQAAVMLGNLSTQLLQRDHLVARSGGESDTGYSLKQESRSLLAGGIKERLEFSYESFQTAWDEAYKQGPVRMEVLERLDERQQKAIRLYAEKYPDDYDREKRKEIEAPLETGLGMELLNKRTAEDLSDLTRQAYQEVIGNASISNSRVLQRAENAVEKKKLQMALKNRMEIFLNKRQIRIGKALAKDFYFFSDAKKEWKDRTENQQLVQSKSLDVTYLKFMEDWCATDTPSSILKIMAPDKVSKSIPMKIQDAGKHLLALDLTTFEYKSDAEFVSKLQDNYQWLKMAESLKEVFEIEKRKNSLQSNRDLALSVLEGRLKVFTELKEDYDARIAMMNSPYYALLARTDLQSLSDEELERKQQEAEQTNPALFDFLKNYRFLNRQRESFGKGVSAVRREEILSGDLKTAEAAKQEEALNQIREFGLLPMEGEDRKDYAKRMTRVLTEKAEAQVPGIDGDYVKTHVPPLANRFANMDPPDVKELEIWLENQLSNEEMLKENGLSDPEIAELKELRRKAYEARRGVEIRGYIKMQICKDWNSTELENPQMNDKLNTEVYQTLQLVYDTFDRISTNLGKQPQQVQGSGEDALEKARLFEDMDTEQVYASKLMEMTQILSRHKILFTKDANAVLEKGKEKAKKQAEEDLKAGKGQVIHIGGKEYRMAADKNVEKQLNGLSIKEEDRTLVEEKLNRIQELFHYVNGCNIIRIDAKGGVYIAEFADIRAVYADEINQLVREIKELGKKA